MKEQEIIRYILGQGFKEILPNEDQDFVNYVKEIENPFFETLTIEYDEGKLMVWCNESPLASGLEYNEVCVHSCEFTLANYLKIDEYFNKP